MKYKILKAFRQPNRTIHALVEIADGRTVSVQLPDWADKKDIRQEAARQVELANTPEEVIPELID